MDRECHFIGMALLKDRYAKVSSDFKVRVVHKCTCSYIVYANRAADVESVSDTATSIIYGLILNQLQISFSHSPLSSLLYQYS